MAEESPDSGSAGSLGDEGGGEQGQGPVGMTRKGKSCKGCLYYSSILRSGSNSPVCVGINRTLPRVPLHIIGDSEVKTANSGNNLLDFKYACVGYSVFLDNKDDSTDMQGDKVQLPFCAGLELLVEKKMSNNDHVNAPVHKEDSTARTASRAHRPAHSSGDELLSRFRRNAGLVAAGVVKNLSKVGNYIKENIDDIMYPYRKRPK